MKNFKTAFTMIELVFVIVILGILSAVAIPKLSAYIEDANLAKAQSAVAAIRVAVNIERQKRILSGNFDDFYLDEAGTGNHVALFDGNATVSILGYPIYSKNATDTSGWMKTTNNAGATIGYTYHLNATTSVAFTYTKSTRIFDCNHSISTCQDMTE